MKKLLYITNPVAGKLGSRTALFDVVEEFCKSNYEVTVAITQHRGHCSELSAEAAGKGYDLVVCAGGDGTVKETISGLMQSDVKLPFGYIPCGSTNDFGNTLGLSMIPAKAAKTITEDKPAPLDVGSFNEHYFAYVASFGMLTAVSYSVPQDLKNTFGYLAYLVEGIKDFTNIKPYKMKVSADDQEYEGEYIFGCVSNSTSVAGFLHPEGVDLTDGMFELLLVRKPEGPLDFNKIMQGAISSDFSSDIYVYTKAKKIVFDFEQPMTWSLDGEKEESGQHVEINNIHNELRIFK